jgi:hypothetical protein
MIDIKSLTLGEIDFFETTTGMAIDAFGDGERPKGKALAVMVYLFKKRHDSKFTLNDAMDLSIAEATDFLGLGDDVDPDSEEGKA